MTIKLWYTLNGIGDDYKVLMTAMCLFCFRAFLQYWTANSVLLRYYYTANLALIYNYQAAIPSHLGKNVSNGAFYQALATK